MSGDTPELVDKQVLEVLQDAIGDSLKRIIDLYVNDVPDSIREMHKALANDDLITVRRLAHSLKSSSANLGAMQTSALSADLEQQIDDGETDAERINIGIDLISDSFDQASTILQGIQLNKNTGNSQ